MSVFSERKLLLMCEAVHYDLLQGMYYNSEVDIDGVKVVESDTINDAVWNYATRVQMSSQNFGLTIKSVSDFLRRNHKRPAFYITPFRAPRTLSNKIEPLTAIQLLKLSCFKQYFVDAWMFLEKEPSDIEIKNPYNIRIAESRGDMWLFKQIYDAAYSSGPGPYSFPPEYGWAVYNSFKRQPEGVNARHYIMFKGQTAVGILSLMSKDDLFGIYNVGTHPDYQGLGIGSKLTLLASRYALAKGAKAVFLQTASGSTNESFYQKRGFTTKFEAECYVLE